MKEIVRKFINFILASVLKRKLDLYLSEQNAGKVVDIKFIPDYKILLELERQRNEIIDIRNK